MVHHFFTHESYQKFAFLSKRGRHTRFPVHPLVKPHSLCLSGLTRKYTFYLFVVKITSHYNCWIGYPSICSSPFIIVIRPRFCSKVQSPASLSIDNKTAPTNRCCSDIVFSQQSTYYSYHLFLYQNGYWFIEFFIAYNSQSILLRQIFSVRNRIMWI